MKGVDLDVGPILSDRPVLVFDDRSADKQWRWVMVDVFWAVVPALLDPPSLLEEFSLLASMSRMRDDRRSDVVDPFVPEQLLPAVFLPVDASEEALA